MPRRTLEDKNVRNIQNSKGTYYVSLPIEVVERLGWRKRQKVRVEQYGRDKIIIKDWEK